MGVIAAAIVTLAAAWLSCVELYNADDERIVPTAAAPADCTTDADCALMPARFTCCGECEPAPPRVAATPACTYR
jgi:hypothetical protein